MLNWFGPSWGSPVNTMCPRVETPVGERCDRCINAFVEGDRGVTMPALLDNGRESVAAYHVECLLDLIGMRFRLPESPE